MSLSVHFPSADISQIYWTTGHRKSSRHCQIFGEL